MSEDPSPSEDFESAKSVVEKLASVPRERQERILRWVSESLGIHLPGPVSAVAAPSQPIAPVAPTPSAIQPGGAKDIKAFVAEKAPKSDNQFAAAVAYYYRFEAPVASRREAIDGTMLQEAARLARWRRPKRPTDTLNNARKAGYLDSAERGSFRLNNVGENLVAMAMPGGSATSSGRKTKRRSRGAPKKTKAKGR